MMITLLPTTSGRRPWPIAMALVLTAVAGAACGSTDPMLVAGTYTGSVTVEAEAQGQSTTLNGSMAVVAEQSADTVDLSVTIEILGSGSSSSSGVGTIDGSGVWTDAGEGLFEVGGAGCPGYSHRVEARFSDASLAIESTATHPEPTSDCPNVTMSADLTRS